MIEKMNTINELDKKLLSKALLIYKNAQKTKSGCLEASGWHNGSGYRKVQCLRKRAYVHRLICEHFNKISVKNKVVMHTCDNPKCVNPDHLKVGTQLENVRDMISKNRNYKKEVNLCKKGHQLSIQNYKARPSGTKKYCRICVNQQRAEKRRLKNPNLHQYKPKNTQKLTNQEN